MRLVPLFALLTDSSQLSFRPWTAEPETLNSWVGTWSSWVLRLGIGSFCHLLEVANKGFIAIYTALLSTVEVVSLKSNNNYKAWVETPGVIDMVKGLSERYWWNKIHYSAVLNFSIMFLFDIWASAAPDVDKRTILTCLASDRSFYTRKTGTRPSG
jgi:hypothetical protein